MKSGVSNDVVDNDGVNDVAPPIRLAIEGQINAVSITRALQKVGEIL
jgi:hypothetical protein